VPAVLRVLLILATAAMAWAVGLLVFLGGLPAGAPQTGVRAEGVVVYTGVGGQRVSTGMSLLGEGAADRLLISGVNPRIQREELERLWRGAPEAFDCCVDLGREALSTQGNALEVREWALTHGFKSLILVTSDYHMPRALLETHDQLPDVEIIAYPVQSGYLDANGRPADVKAWRLLAVEYSKYLLVRVKTAIPI
jgi:uncharacterized SAM-binding protein YcdF (DUF218 family)